MALEYPGFHEPDMDTDAGVQLLYGSFFHDIFDCIKEDVQIGSWCETGL